MEKTLHLKFNADYTRLENPHILRSDEKLPPMDFIKFIDGGYQLVVSMIGYEKDSCVVFARGDTIQLDAKSARSPNAAIRLFQGIFAENLSINFVFDNPINIKRIEMPEGLLIINFYMRPS